MDNTPGLEGSNLEEPTSNITPPKGLPKGISGNWAGKGVHLRKVEEFEQLPEKEQHAYIRDLWKSIACGIAHRSRQFSATCAPKDFDKLYKLVQAGATAIDRAFPPKQELQAPKLIFNLFNSLGQRATRIAVPEVPIIDAKAIQSPPIPVSTTVQQPIDEVQSESRSIVTVDSGGDRPPKDPGEL